MHEQYEPTAQDRTRIRARCYADDGAIREAYRNPDHVREATHRRVTDAARAEGLPLPPPRSAQRRAA
jgi:hypothetical protein